MHHHATNITANKCSRFCIQNYQDKAYWQRHGHVRDVAPVRRCYECESDAKRAEEARRAY